ncbi:MAG: hypothetical protein HQL37_04390 [Alphaproteobacteria bacterium]|nr:hypothetical protein [Alphaproteobacteria bacterium]
MVTTATAAAATTAASTTTPAAPSTAAASAAKLSNDMGTFLNLLTTQLKYQDPTSPMDSTQFTSQLVQFSSVEQQINTNSNLEKLITMQQTNQTTQALGYLGATVVAQTNQVPLTNGQATFNYTVPAQYKSASVMITDSVGNQVYDGPIPATAGNNTYNWNGLNNAGTQAPDGAYTVSVSGTDGTGAVKTIPTLTVAQVIGIQSANGSTSVALGNGSVETNITNIQAVTMPSSPSSSSSSSSSSSPSSSSSAAAAAAAAAAQAAAQASVAQTGA